ncbi:MAG TPA: enoyl-CoA hydratase/isomerase family protein [Terriglobales bacterium]|nr:enoyl-CoA hydratase/isomerase family protein [Terriglobales bacterium]
MSDVLVSIQGRAGRITLNRPAALNALTYEMVAEIHRALDSFAGDAHIALIVIDAVGERAFCAGGDIVMLYKTGKSQPELGRAFWRDEYRLNAAIARYPKPYVAILDGIVMGGGIGVGGHASHRVVTERSVLAMPETAIGFAPDVGGTRLLALAPGHVGEYLAMTGGRMSGADAIFAGFADYFVPSQKLPALIEALEASGDPASIARFAETPPPSDLASHAREIDAAFAAGDAVTIMARLQGTPFGEKTAAVIARNSPFSVAAALETVRRVRQDPDIVSCLALEYRFSHRALENPNFYEGVRAAVIDKDRSPVWRPKTLAEVDPQAVQASLASLGPNEWTL